MRPDTTIVLGIRSVGDKGAQHIIESMTMIEALKRVGQFVAESSMHQRFQFTFARSPEDALIGLGLSQDLKAAKRQTKANEIAQMFDEMFAPAGGQAAESNERQALDDHVSGLPRFLKGAPIEGGEAQ